MASAGRIAETEGAVDSSCTGGGAAVCASFASPSGCRTCRAAGGSTDAAVAAATGERGMAASPRECVGLDVIAALAADGVTLADLSPVEAPDAN